MHRKINYHSSAIQYRSSRQHHGRQATQARICWNCVKVCVWHSLWINFLFYIILQCRMLLHVAHWTYFSRLSPKPNDVEINCRNLCGFLQYAPKCQHSDFMLLEVVAGLIWFAGRGSLTETFNSLCRNSSQKWSFTERKVCPPPSVPLPPTERVGRQNEKQRQVEEDMNKRRRWETRERKTEHRIFNVSHRTAVTGVPRHMKLACVPDTGEQTNLLHFYNKWSTSQDSHWQLF